MKPTVCCYCAQPFHPDELRSCGPDGALCCCECAFATPERAERAQRALDAMYGAAVAASPDGIAAITDHGYEPFDSSMLEG